MDPGTGSRRHRQLTSGQDTSSARCGESRTAGAEGGLRETTGGNTGTAPAGLPYKAAWCFHPARDPAIEAWVTAQGPGILHGRAAQVTQTIRQLAAQHPPRPGSEHAKIIRKTLTYLDAKEPYLDYPRALASGWPIATGVIEGACRHLVQDRMGITGARWSLEGAQAILWLRAIRANGDLDTYWNWHLHQEHHRNHLSRYHHGLELAA
jgi:hypothetical protein